MLSVENIEFLKEDMEEVAFKIVDRYVCVQTCEEGYDYSIFDEELLLLDGGIYDDPELTFKQAIREILADLLIDDFLRGNVNGDSKIVKVDFDMVMDQGLLADRRKAEELIVANYKQKVEEYFHPICGMGQEQVIVLARDYLQEKIECYDLDARIREIVIVGSRSKGVEKDTSDIDFVVEYEGSVREDFLFNIAHEDDFYIGNVLADINPINIEKTGFIHSRYDVNDYLKSS